MGAREESWVSFQRDQKAREGVTPGNSAIQTPFTKAGANADCSPQEAPGSVKPQLPRNTASSVFLALPSRAWPCSREDSPPPSRRVQSLQPLGGQTSTGSECQPADEMPQCTPSRMRRREILRVGGPATGRVTQATQVGSQSLPSPLSWPRKQNPDAPAPEPGCVVSKCPTPEPCVVAPGEREGRASSAGPSLAVRPAHRGPGSAPAIRD